MQESQNIEWKRSWHDDYLKWICGFANANGGSIYIGKDDNENVVHLENYQSLLESIPNKIREHLGIICVVNLLEIQEKKFIEILVNPYSVAVSLRGRYYLRSGSTKLELTGVELNEFLLKKSGKSWDDVVEEGISISDIDELSVSKFVRDGNLSGRMPETLGLPTFDILSKLRLTENNKIKRAAVILFGSDPMKFYPSAMIKIGRFGTDGSDLRFQEIIEGNLVYLLSEVETQLNYKFLTQKINFEGLHRIEKGEYPVAAIREILLNALVHRSYAATAIQIRVFDHKLSIWNEGALPIGLSIDSLKKDHNSRPRNPKIADACFKAGYIESWGRGTLKIINTCHEAGLPEPEIIEKDGGIEVTIFKPIKPIEKGGQIGVQIGGQKSNKTGGQIINKKGGQNNSKKGSLKDLQIVIGQQDDNIISSKKNAETTLEIGGQIIEKIGSQIEVKFTKRETEIFQLILSNNSISRKEISQLLMIAESAVQKHIKSLVNKKTITRVGTKNGFWKIKR